MNKEKKRFKKFLGYFLVFFMVFSCLQCRLSYADENTENVKTFIGSNFEVTFQINSKWGTTFNGSITIKNTGNTAIEDWKLRFSMNSQVSNIWNASVLKHGGQEYIIENAGWNSDIQPGQEVSFGFTAECPDEIVIPDKYTILNSQASVQNEKYKVQCDINNQWSTGYTGQIAITNLSVKEIEDWQILFDMDKQITSIWGANIVSIDSGRYTVKNAGYNANIKPGETVIFGFCAETTDSEVSQGENYELIEINYAKDSDNEGLVDYIEDDFGTDKDNADTDGDGMNDYYETVYSTNPLLTDTNGDGISDGDEVYPISYTTAGNDEDSTVDASVDINLTGKQLDTLNISKIPDDDVFLSSNIPGYIGNACEFTVDGTFDNATIKFTYKIPENTENFEPAIYYFNEDEQWFEELPNQVLEGNTVSAEVHHFSKYIVLNRVEFKKVWNEEIRSPENQKRNMDLSLVIDTSNSMKKNDPRSLRVQVGNTMVNEMHDGDRCAVIKFGGKKPTLLTSFTGDKTLIRNCINSTTATKLGTPLYKGIKMANKDFAANSTDDNVYKVMVVLTDGVDTEAGVSKQALINQALASNVLIYTVSLGNNIDEAGLRRLASGTGGRYYHADIANDLVGIFDNITQETVDLIADSDGDGIADYFEDNLYTLFNGEMIYLDKNNPDTDGDGIKDGDEVSVTISSTGIVYYRMNSHPTKVDTDGDGINDADDQDPLLYNIV